ncbi:MAG: hypothetical protein QF685_09120 [Verrucomicrobiota bacterium]|jgi:putative SOS response-associated peptidase YedK|nr:hypothetical protein [Verrucomicrobiota bacterium]
MDWRMRRDAAFLTMWGRYSETVDPMQLVERPAIDLCTYEFASCPVIVPTQTASVIVCKNGQIELKPMSWGAHPPLGK